MSGSGFGLKWLWMLLTTLALLPSVVISALPELQLTGLKTESPEAKGDWSRIVIPLKRAGNLILIEARIDSLYGNFILDTGAPYLVLNQTYFRSYETSTKTASVGLNGTSTATRTNIPKLDLGILFYEDVEADIVNLRQIEDQKKIQVFGLLGTNLFTGLLVQIDLVLNQMILYRLNATGEVIFESDSLSADTLFRIANPDMRLTFKLCDDKIFVPVEIGGQKMNWILDTGAETNVVDAWSKKKVIKEFVVSRRINLVGSTGEKQEILLGVMPQTHVGEEVFPMQQTIVTSMQELSETCSLYIDGILGYSFLSQGVFTINFVKKEFSMYLYNASK
ncbi:MAG: aspartyl protease family protein [Flavobacteriales bacterium]